MVKLKKMYIVAALCSCGALAFADNTDQAASPTPATAHDIESIKELIRDTSWPVTITYNPNAYYELTEQMYKDKVSIRVVTLNSNLDYLFGLFGSAIPRQWHISVKEVAIQHLDALDAMAIAAQDGNAAIIKASLDLLPYTKSALASGRTTDFMDHVFTVNGKFKVNHIIELACDSMASKLNKFRTSKFISGSYAVALFMPETIGGLPNPVLRGTRAATHSLIECFFGETTPRTPRARDIASALGSSYYDIEDNTTRIVGIASAIASLLTHRLEHLYIKGYLGVLEAIINAEQLTFDHEKTRQKLQQLYSKLQWFGVQTNETQRLQTLIDKLA